MFRSAILSSHVVWGPGPGSRGTWMRGHSSAPRGLLSCSPGGSQWGELASLLMWLGRKAWGGATWSSTLRPLSLAGTGLETLWSPRERETSLVSCPGMNSICHPAHMGLDLFRSQIQ